MSQDANINTTHKWNSEFCSCGSDTCLCQVCGKVVCATLASWVPVPGAGRNGNVCLICQGRGEDAPAAPAPQTAREYERERRRHAQLMDIAAGYGD